MLVFSYGIPKSGSTLAFNIARAVAMLGGHPQRRLAPPLASPAGRVNYQQDLDPAMLRDLARLAEGRILLMKTHAPPGPDWIAEYRRLAAAGRVGAHVNHRDPRDICLALLDAGAAARAAGQAAFSEYAELWPTAGRVARYLEELALWAALPGVLELRYEVCAFRMDTAIAAIRTHLGVRCPNWPVRLYAGRIAFSHRNRALPERHRAELPPGEQARLSALFAPYLDRMGYPRG
jgi:hypothetical protein